MHAECWLGNLFKWSLERVGKRWEDNIKLGGKWVVRMGN
jgi:hypothetical protein